MSPLTWAYLGVEWTIRVVMLIYVPQRRSAAASRTWLLLIFLLPIPGLLVYLVIGRVYLPGWRVARQIRASQLVREAVANADLPETDVPKHLRDVAQMVERLGDFPVRGGNSVELFTDYGATIQRIIADIDAAQSSANLLFYIFADDATGRAVCDALRRARDRGVACRVMMDDLGSRGGLRALAPGLRACGVDVRAALPARLARRIAGAARLDLRNHRKIVVVDGRIAWTGSQNVVDAESVAGFPNEELVVRVTGPVARQLQAVFLEDWFFETGEELRDPALLPPPVSSGTVRAQVLPSGPGYLRQNAQELLVHLLHEAEERVVVTTPYFVPDEPFSQGLRTAVRRGVEAHLIVSNEIDSRLTAAAQRAYFDDLLEAGVKIHLYRPRFLHAKHMTVDRNLALIGSINMDIRSFALNEEVGLLVYDESVATEMREIQERYIRDSLTLTEKDWRARSWVTKVAENTARLADSLL